MVVRGLFDGTSSIKEIYEKGEIFLDSNGGAQFVEFCEDHDWAVIGIEGGKFDGVVFTPDSSLIEDYSTAGKIDDWMGYRQQCNANARKFLERFVDSSDVRFYLVFIDEFEHERLGDLQGSESA